MTELLQAHIPELAVAGALAFGAGLRLYLVIFIFGLAGAVGWWDLPGHLDVLQWVRANGCPWDKYTCSFAAVAAILTFSSGRV